MAKLYFRYGAMGSSKSANILMVRYNYEERNVNSSRIFLFCN
jgi:thymidine kinase